MDSRFGRDNAMEVNIGVHYREIFTEPNIFFQSRASEKSFQNVDIITDFSIVFLAFHRSSALGFRQKVL